MVQSVLPAGAGIVVRADASSQFLGIDWGAFVIVFLIALVAAGAIVAIYSMGLRLLAVGAPVSATSGDAPTVGSANRPVAATIGAYLCFAVSIAAVLYGLYLVIPQFH